MTKPPKTVMTNQQEPPEPAPVIASGFLGALVAASANLVNAHFQRKMTRELAQRRGQHEIQLQEQQRRNDEAAIDLKAAHDLERTYAEADLRHKIYRGGMPYPPGRYRDSVGLQGPEPFFVFSSPLRQDHHKQESFFGYNPVTELYKRFATRTQGVATSLETHHAFLAEDEATAFVVREFPGASVVVVYGDYLGHELNVRATFQGMNRDQYVLYDDGEIGMLPGPRTLFLGSLARRTSASGQPSMSRDEEILMYDLIVSVWLHLLVDSYYMFNPHRPYQARTQDELTARAEQLDQLGLQSVRQELETLVAKSDTDVARIRTEMTLLRSRRVW